MRRVCPNCEHEGDEPTCPVDGYAMVRLEETSEGSHHHLLGRIFEEQYQILKLLGTGGMGWVFEAKNLKTEQLVALKVMRRSEEADLARVKRFYAEVRMTRQLTQPHTLRVFDFGSSKDGYLYMAMELLQGQPMSDLVILEAPLEPRRVARILQQVCYALAEAHEHGLVHRDLKPENIFLCDIGSEPEFVKVVDFGVAKALDGDEEDSLSRITRTGTTVGTPAYMSPEQATLGPMDGRTDIYSLGVVAYEALCGRVPFDYESPFKVLMGHIQQPAPPIPSEIRGRTIPVELRVLVGEMLAKEQDKRPSSTQEIAERLNPYVSDGSPVGPSPRGGSLPSTPLQSGRSQRQKIILNYALPALTFVLMVAVGIWLMKGPFSERQRKMLTGTATEQPRTSETTSRGKSTPTPLSQKSSLEQEGTVTKIARENPEAAARELYLERIEKRLERVRQCGTRHLTKLPTGTDVSVALAITISRTGKVSDVVTAPSTLHTPEFIECVHAQFERLEVPPSGLLITVKADTNFKMTR